ncbi:hypothetical protein HA402_003959 [Bradysia odoriphaga]|nr:hypothetical protein HA402_003959 [Bradysia odoriphaga]
MESNEKIGYCRYVVPHEKDNSINSDVIVKQTTVMCAKFSKLECNTNLNLPPSNWLTNDGNSYGLRSCLSPSKGFSSFRMAHMFPDCLGEIDVVSSAENIKNLLKLPYSPKSTISMMVHRIENTLLLDDFDLYKFLLQQADDDWKWLRKFIFENLSPKDRSMLLKNYCSKENFDQKKLLSKFLYHSIRPDQPSSDKPSDDAQLDSSTILQEIRSGPLLPEPSVDENIPENGDHIFNRNVVWTFEDIRMLIGTDMPIFGGQTQPCISLKLRDMSQPINILTGIDYWLDNLMCNVPEVVMCYHLDGLVQKYELIKTEDLPYLENSNFSPKVIRNVAQNILSFLKRSATKSGHTYWLFKGSNDDFVKLYDLTSLCHNTEENKPEHNSTETTNLENPFTVPVAMLLYKVAKNMKNMTENMTAKQAGSIKALLDNCIQLLPKEKYPQIVTSSHYMLSDLLLPADIDPSSPIFYPSGQDTHLDNSTLSESDVTSDVDESNNSDEIALKTVIESNLEKNWKHNSSPPPITDDVKERCMLALEHIAEGLNCLQFFSQTEDKEKRELDKETAKRKIILEELNPKMAEPCVPIPLPYETLKPEARQINSTKAIPMGWKTDSTPATPTASPTATANRKNKKKKKKTKKQTNVDDRKEDGRSLLLKGMSGVIQSSWNVHLKLLLLEKACLTYATLAEQFYEGDNFGKTLRFILMALNCQKIVAKYMNSISDQTVCLMGRAGDCFFRIATNVENKATNRNEFYCYSKTDLAISQELQKEGKITDVFDLDEDMDDLLFTSLKCYASALDMLEPDDDKRRELVRRIGSVRNEIGARSMHQAQEEYAKCARDDLVNNQQLDASYEPLYKTLTKRSYANLQRGIEAFEEIKDEANLAILLCNMGRYYRFRASIYLPGDKSDTTDLKRLYESAFYHYNRALGILGSRKDNPELSELWDILTWELSTSTFTWAQMVMENTEEFLQDDENYTKLNELWQKALKACDDKTSGPRQTLYKNRKAVIHARIGEIFYKLYVRERLAGKKVHSQLCHLHDDKAIKLLKELCSSIADANLSLAIHLRQMELHSLCADDFFKGTARIVSLRLSLSYALNAKFIFQLYADQAENITDDIIKQMENFEKSLQSILKKAVQVSMKSLATTVTNSFKCIYALTLRKPEKLNGLQMATHLMELLDKMTILPDIENVK